MTNVRKIAVASDHAGFDTKQDIIQYLVAQGYDVKDFGAFSAASADYPDFAHPMAQAVESGDYQCAISLCGSGNGINITANKHQGIRSALCWDTEIALLARQHNDANVCAIPARFVSVAKAIEIVDAFLDTAFDGGRHQVRIDKIPLS